MTIERFAPSPTGFLHLGHAYSALLAYNSALESGGKFLIRIEDIDRFRCKKKYVSQILDDLNWLGIKYEKPILNQSTRFLNIKTYSKNYGKLIIYLHVIVRVKKLILLQHQTRPKGLDQMV